MPSDTKLGLIVGIGLVITVAILFFRGEQPPPALTETPQGTAQVAAPPKKPSSVAVPPPLSRPASAD